MCRRATGGAFAVLALFGRDEIVRIARKPEMRRSSPIAERSFRPQYGTPLVLSCDGHQDVAIMIGNLDHPEEWPPTYIMALKPGYPGRIAEAACLRGK
jgi:hypothetical protein